MMHLLTLKCTWCWELGSFALATKNGCIGGLRFEPTFCEQQSSKHVGLSLACKNTFCVSKHTPLACWYVSEKQTWKNQFKSDFKSSSNCLENSKEENCKLDVLCDQCTFFSLDVFCANLFWSSALPWWASNLFENNPWDFLMSQWWGFQKGWFCHFLAGPCCARISVFS